LHLALTLLKNAGTGSITGSDAQNIVTSAEMSIGLKRFPELYQVEYAQNVSGLYSASKWNMLLTEYDEIASLSASEKAMYMDEVSVDFWAPYETPRNNREMA